MTVFWSVEAVDAEHRRVRIRGRQKNCCLRVVNRMGMGLRNGEVGVVRRKDGGFELRSEEFMAD